MKRLIILAVAIIAAAALLGRITPAHADNSFINSCGASNSNFGLVSVSYLEYLGREPDGNGDWEMKFTINCGSGGTLEWELQALVSGSYGDVHEANGGNIDHQVTNPSTGQNSFVKDPISLNDCVSGRKYRLQFWWTNPSGFAVVQATQGVAFC